MLRVGGATQGAERLWPQGFAGIAMSCGPLGRDGEAAGPITVYGFLKISET